MKVRCIWCNKSGEDLKEIEALARNRFFRDSRPRRFYVHPAHEAEFRAFNDRVQRLGGWFLGLIGLALVSMLTLQFLLLTSGRGAAIAVTGALTLFIGAVIIAMPFATPETVSLVGIRGAVRLVRFAGVAVVGLGLFVIKLAAG